MEFLPPTFEALRTIRQFIIYHLVPSTSRKGKTDKKPIHHLTGYVPASGPLDPETWTDIDTAIAAVKKFGADFGIGFVLTENDPFWFLDIDNCLEPDGTAWSPLAISLLAAFPGAAVEVSSSKRGLHILGSGKAPPHTCRDKKKLNLELYTENRFVALTGIHASGDISLDCSAVLPWLVENYFNPSESGPSGETEWTDQACIYWFGPEDDDLLIERALRSQSGRSVFAGSASFRDLWEGNVMTLTRAFPDPEVAHGYNASTADRALAQHLAFWTGNNCERIKRLMLVSGLIRDKWNREDYLIRTIKSACAQQHTWLLDKRPEVVAVQPQADPEAHQPVIVKGSTFVTIEQQIEMFKGCVYILDDHKVLVPGGCLLNPERFRVIFGGFTFPMDYGNERTVRNAWECFTESQAFRRQVAMTSCFRPDLTPGKIIEKDGQTLVNIYWPVNTPRQKGDPGPFLRHVEKLIPDKRDQTILISYMSACVQYKGVKFQWCPLIQGVQGNGKSLFTRCVAFAIGDRYSHFPRADKIDSNFNAWLYGKLFIGIEDIYVKDSQAEVMEILKPMITGERQVVEPKTVDQVTRDICANFLINTNHKDGLRLALSDRRFAPFYTAQQSLADLKRDGMIGSYFPDLYHWLRDGGYAIVSEFLHTYPIPQEFNPTGRSDQRAPITMSSESAIAHGRGGIEQEVLEAVEQELIGFRGGWISSMFFDRLLEKLNAARRIPLNKRRDLLYSLGYSWHPGLKDGRVNRNIFPDNGKPRLYIHEDNPARLLEIPADIAEAYTIAQKAESC